MDKLLNKYKELTKKIKAFHPFQSNAIANILERRSTLVIAPTGKGKSLIYQIAGQELSGITIVVSPLIALISEQTGYLGNDRALNLSSTLSFQDQREVLRKFAKGKYQPKFIFVSPERLQNYFFRAALKMSGVEVSLVVVDEAHCISQWGFDFRPEYSQITKFVDYLKSIDQQPCLLAMTATIGQNAKEDIVGEFQIEASSVFYDQDVVRSELKLDFIEVDEENEKPDEIVEILKQYKPKKAIIYFYDKANLRKINRKLNGLGFSSGTFYSGMSADDKSKNYTKFKSGGLEVLCATTAFGMGMNIPDIDMVIHHRLPDSIEEYYQQVGRAARDKTLCPVANCIALWSKVNFDYKLDEFIPAVILGVDEIQEVFKKMELSSNANKIQSMEYSNYISQDLARVRFELEHYGIIKTMGEVNGTPKTIKFKKENKYWNDIIKKMARGNSFIRAAEKSDISLKDLIDYVFECELNDKIKTFPAMEKKIFFVSSYDEVPLDVCYEIVDKSMKLADFKEKQVQDLREMLLSDDKMSFIQDYFLSLRSTIKEK